MPRPVTAAIAAIAAAGLIAVAAAPTAAALDRIRLVNVNGYSVIDREHLILNGSASRVYLVTLSRPCQGLNFGAQVGLSFPATTTIYNPRFEFVSTRDDPRCYIDDIEQVESEDAARELVQARAEAEADAES